jgi:hypothetical protein
MVSAKMEKRIEEHLQGCVENFLRDSRLFGLTHAIHEFHMEDISFTYIYDWAQSKTKETLHSDLGLLRAPVSGDTRYMEDFLTVILKRFSEYKEEIAKLEAENEHLRQAITYHRSHPLDACNELLGKIINDKKE